MLLNASTCSKPSRPERIMQFGEGNFLRAFVDMMVQRMNALTPSWNGSVVIVKPRPGSTEKFDRQDCMYQVWTRGLGRNGEVDEVELIDSVSRIIDPNSTPDSFWKLAENPDIKWIVSNTTEAGIIFDPDDTDSPDGMPRTFPGKLTRWLYLRFESSHGDKSFGVVILPCELIENNARHLRECIDRYASKWNLPAAFTEWINSCCRIIPTLVDRIVPGRPSESEVVEITSRTGYDDKLIVKGELYHLWVIGASAQETGNLPLKEAGINVEYVPSVKPCYDRKVTILNAAHSALAPMALLAGETIVRETCLNPTMRRWIDNLIYDNLVPSLPYPVDEMKSFADDVMLRFLNPFIDHDVRSIMLNAFPKFASRDIPVLKRYREKYGKLPQHIVEGLAALACCYRGDVVAAGDLFIPNDNPEIIDEVACAWKVSSIRETATRILAMESVWNENLNLVPGLTDALASAIDALNGSFIRIHPDDNVEVALADTPLIPRGHKRALQNFAQGDNIVKYGSVIGTATRNIRKWEWIDADDIATTLNGEIDLDYTPALPDIKKKDCDDTVFNGYRRRGNKAGIRNEIWIVPTVGCVGKTAEKLATRFIERHPEHEGIDGIYAFNHNYGCSQLGHDHEATREILRDIVLHPNAGGVLVVGLGCENNQPAMFRTILGDYDSSRIKFLIAQETPDELTEGDRLLDEIYDTCRHDRREPLPLSMLRVGLKCGGSDGLSGITANPLLGRLSEWLWRRGASLVMSEVPEMFGAEHILGSRCVSPDIFERFKEMIDNFRIYYISHGEPVGENPSPGNKRGGISTLEEKSLGCIQKCGCLPVEDVIPYGDVATASGLTLLSGPGNDLVSSTALAAAGCQMILFSTGRGTPFGTFVPTVKIATNTPLATKKPGWIDFNAGEIADGTDPEELLSRLISTILDIASGTPARNETAGYRDIAIFRNGVTL